MSFLDDWVLPGVAARYGIEVEGEMMNTEETGEERRDERTRLRAEAFNRAADLNITQIMERIGGLEKSVTNMQNQITESVVRQVAQHVSTILNQQQETAADELELLTRMSRLENIVMRRLGILPEATGREQSIAGLAWGIIALCAVIAGATIWYAVSLLM
jgi:hypothetical protein